MSLLARSMSPGRLGWAGRAAVGLVIPLVLLLLALSLTGVGPLDVLNVIAESLRSPSLQADALLQTVPILLLALGSCLCFRAGFWNIGGEAYFYGGAITATAVGLKLDGLPPVVLVPLMAVAAGSVGMLLSGIAGVLRARRGINEVVVTLMLNLAMIQMVAYAVRGPLADPSSRLAFSATLSASATLPSAHLPGMSSRVHAGVYVAVAAALLVWHMYSRTTFGHVLRVVGENPEAAVGSGIDVRRAIVVSSLIFGVLGGLAGMLHVAGDTQRLYVGLSPAPGFGYVAVMTALLGGMHPLGAVISTMFYAFLSGTSDTLQIEFGIPGGVITIFFVLVLVSVLATDTVLRRRGDHAS